MKLFCYFLMTWWLSDSQESWVLYPATSGRLRGSLLLDWAASKYAVVLCIKERLGVQEKAKATYFLTCICIIVMNSVDGFCIFLAVPHSNLSELMFYGMWCDSPPMTVYIFDGGGTDTGIPSPSKYNWLFLCVL